MTPSSPPPPTAPSSYRIAMLDLADRTNKKADPQKRGRFHSRENRSRARESWHALRQPVLVHPVRRLRRMVQPASVRALLCYWELRVGHYLPTAI
jgi:hypothetical protein